MKNLLWGFAAVAVFGFTACQNKDTQLSGQIQEQATAAESSLSEFNTMGQNLSTLVSQVEQAPEELKNDTSSQYSAVQRRAVTFQPKMDKMTDEYEAIIGKMKTLAADYAAGKVSTEDAKKQFTDLQTQAKEMAEHLESYKKAYDEISADYAKMMADFKGKSN